MEDNNKTGLALWGIGFIVLAATIIGAILMVVLREPDVTTVQINPPRPTATATATATPEPLEIYVVGAILTPEARISLPVDSRVEDALAVVGVQENADLTQVNLAQVLNDGDMIFVPEQNEMAVDAGIDPNTAVPTTPTPNSPSLININIATVEELDTLPGIGPAIAQRIITYREENGDFSSIEEIINVRGIGEGTLDDMRPYITVE